MKQNTQIALRVNKIITKIFSLGTEMAAHGIVSILVKLRISKSWYLLFMYLVTYSLAQKGHANRPD